MTHHLCRHCQIGTRVFAGQSTVTVCSWCGQPWTLTAEQLMERQQRYNALAEHFGMHLDAHTPWRAGLNAFEVHQRIVRILDGDEPWPDA